MAKKPTKFNTKRYSPKIRQQGNCLWFVVSANSTSNGDNHVEVVVVNISFELIRIPCELKGYFRAAFYDFLTGQAQKAYSLRL